MKDMKHPIALRTQNDGNHGNFGKCDSTFESQDDFFCFVDEQSICPKIPSSIIKPGTYISTIPCEDSNAPNHGFSIHFDSKHFIIR